MRKIILIFLFMIPSFNIFSQDLKPIAVLELDAIGISSDEAKIITARLRTELFNTSRFMVIERDKMEEILQEQGFQLSGCSTNECIIEAGKLLGVSQMVAGDIGKIGDLFTLTIRIIEVETGKILKTATEDCECGIEKVVTESIKRVAKNLAAETELKTTINENTSGTEEFPSWDNNIKYQNDDGLELTTYFTHRLSINHIENLTISNDLAYYFKRNIFLLTASYGTYSYGGGISYLYSFPIFKNILQPGFTFGSWLSEQEYKKTGIWKHTTRLMYAGPTLRVLLGWKYLKLAFKYDFLVLKDSDSKPDNRIHIGFAVPNNFF